MSRLMEDLSPFPSTASTSQEDLECNSGSTSSRKLRVTLLSSEWRSTKGGLSTINRELAIQLAKHPCVEVSVYLPQCSEEDKRVAASHHIQLIEAEEMQVYDPVDWLSFLPENHFVDCVIGHGAVLGRQVQCIKRQCKCKWIQVVHTAPEELGMYKSYADAISKGQKKHQDEVKLCEKADQVVAVGPKLAEAFSGYLRASEKDQDVLNLTPGIFSEFADVKQATEERKTFSVLVFGRGDNEDFQLKGYDIAALAIAQLKDEPEPYKLLFVGAPSGKEENVKDLLLEQGIDRSQLTVRCFNESREQLARLFCEVDLAIMPSRTEGFGLAALEALSAGLPVLVSGNSGLGEALQEVPFGPYCVVESEDPKEWANAIRGVRKKKRKLRLDESKILCEIYAKVYNWQDHCKRLVEIMCNISRENRASNEQDSSMTATVDCHTGERPSCSEKLPQKGSSEGLQPMKKGKRPLPPSGVPDPKHPRLSKDEAENLDIQIDCDAIEQGVASSTQNVSGNENVVDRRGPSSQEVLNRIADKFIQKIDPSDKEEFNGFLKYMNDVRQVIVVDVKTGSLIITVRCTSLRILDELWKDYCKGHLQEVAQRYLVTEDILLQCGLDSVKLALTISEEEYTAYRKNFLKSEGIVEPVANISIPDDLSSVSDLEAIKTEGEQTLLTDAEPSEFSQDLSPPFKASTSQEGQGNSSSSPSSKELRVISLKGSKEAKRPLTSSSTLASKSPKTLGDEDVLKQESADRDHSKTTESEMSESSQDGSDDITAQVITGLPSNDDTSSPQGDPPELNKVLPSSADIKAITKPSKDADLPVDILLLTVTNCEFSACYSELKNPYRCWFDGLGYVYFSDAGESLKELKVALLRCYKNGIGPGGALVSVKNAASVLRPKAVISVGTCSGLDPAKSKLGDVVVCAKLATYASKVVTSNQEQSTGMRSYVSKRFLDVIKNCADGWQVPLKDLAESQQVQVYTDAEFLSGPEQVQAEWWRDQLAETNPQAMAIENVGEGVFTAAFDCQIEWLIVKGIADYADGSQLPSESWSSFASVMAASLVAHILSEPCVFYSWPHYQDLSQQSFASRSKEHLPSPSDAATAFLEWSQNQLCSFYNSSASQLMITPWDQNNTMDIDEVYVQLTLLRDDRKLAGTKKRELEDYSEIFASHGHHLIPKRILVYGRPGIGKSTLTKKLAVDWSRGNKEILKKFAVVLLIKLRDVCNTGDFCAMLPKAELLSAGDPMVFSQLYDYILRNQQKVLLILDGYDEYSAETSSPVHQIWKGSHLRDCTLLITTRPRKKDELRPRSHAQFEINGFDQWQVTTFAFKFLRDQTEVKKFTNFLYGRNLWDLAEIPLLLLMLVLSWKVSDYQGPSTSRATLYNSFCQTLLDHVTAKTSDETFRSMDEYREDLAKLGGLAWQALLNDCLYFKLSNVPEDIRLFLEKFISFGFLQTSNLSMSPRPEKLAFFLHKSVQEFLSASFLVRNFKNGKETFNCLSKVDSFKRFTELLEVFKFVSELSSEATVAVFRHMKMTAKKEGLTDYNFWKNPSVKELTEEQGNFYRVSLDIFLSCPASDRQAVYPSFLQCVNGVIVIDDFLRFHKQLLTVSREHCLRSTSSQKPDYVFIKGPSCQSELSSQDQMFSVISDLDTVVVTCYGDTKSVYKYRHLKADQFFVKKVGQRSVLCLTHLQALQPTDLPKCDELLRSLISAPNSSEPDHVSENHDVCSSVDLTEETSDHTLTHSLSFLREMKIRGRTNELDSFLNNLHHVPRLSVLDLRDVGMGNQECQLLASALKYIGKLRLLRLSRNPLGHGIIELAKHLHSVPHLKHLHLNNTQMCEGEVTALANSLKNVTQLIELDLSDNPLGHGIRELVKCFPSVPHLQNLMLCGTNMDEEEVTALVHSLQNVTQLSALGLSKNPLGLGISVLAKHLLSVPHLKELYLTDTHMGEEEVTALSHSLQNVTQLSELDVSNNPLGHGISVLAKHLHSVPHLEKLSLNDTQMDEEEVTTLAYVLVNLPAFSLRANFLSLSKNALGRGVTELIKCLRSSLKLGYLRLTHVQLTKKEATELCTLANKMNMLLESDYHCEDVWDDRLEYRLCSDSELREKGVTFDEE